MLSAAELASIQSDAVKATCDKSCSIYRRSSTTPGTSGEPMPNLGLVATTVAGMSIPSAGELANYDYLIGDKAAWTVRMPIGTDVRHQDELVIEGQTLEVHVILTPRSYPALLSVIAAEVK